MINALYFVAVLIVAIFAIISGFRKGITNQLSSLLGFSFGVVSARIFTPEFAQYFEFCASISQAQEFADITVNLICAVIIYVVIYGFFSIFSGILRQAVAVFDVGILNRILGSCFSLVKNLLWLSIILNLALCMSEKSDLLRYEKANDGNLVAAVMAMTTTFLGCYGAEDFAHFYQLKEAKSISCNFNREINVISRKG